MEGQTKKSAEVRRLLKLLRVGEEISKRLQADRASWEKEFPEYDLTPLGSFDEVTALDVLVPVLEEHMASIDVEALIKFYSIGPGAQFLAVAQELAKHSRAAVGAWVKNQLHLPPRAPGQSPR